MIIDCNNMIGKRKFKPEVTASGLISEMDQAGVDRAIIFCFAPVMDNASVQKAVEDYPDRFIGFYTSNPWLDEAVDDLKRSLDSGFRGVRLDPVRHGYPMNELELLNPLLSICEEAKIPIWAYGAAEVFSSPILFQEVAEFFPDLVIIMGHMGYNYEATSAMGVAQRNHNVYLDITGCMDVNVQRAVKNVPVNQILLGTGTPDFGTFDLSIKKVKASIENFQHQDMILGSNAAKIFAIRP